MKTIWDYIKQIPTEVYKKMPRYSKESFEKIWNMKEKQQEIYRNYKCYNRKTRLAIFGREYKGKLQIVEVSCSLKDFFSKKVAKRVFEEFLKLPYETANGKCQINGYYGTFHPNIYLINIKEGDSLKFTFSEHCKNNFYHKFEGEHRYIETYLYKQDLPKVVLNSKRSVKMDRSY